MNASTDQLIEIAFADLNKYEKILADNPEIKSIQLHDKTIALAELGRRLKITV